MRLGGPIESLNLNSTVERHSVDEKISNKAFNAFESASSSRAVYNKNRRLTLLCKCIVYSLATTSAIADRVCLPAGFFDLGAMSIKMCVDL